MGREIIFEIDSEIILQLFLVSAVAAGNVVMIKPSEMTPHASALMKKLISEFFDENEVALLEGRVSTSTELLKLYRSVIFSSQARRVQVR